MSITPPKAMKPTQPDGSTAVGCPDRWTGIVGRSVLLDDDTSDMSTTPVIDVARQVAAPSMPGWKPDAFTASSPMSGLAPLLTLSG
jgi:hypothetical protein